MKKIVAVFVCLLFLASALGMSAVVIAKKPQPPPPPPPEGTVYFSLGQEMWTMKADGSEKTKLGVYPGIDEFHVAFGDVSRLKHGDHYWFIRFCVVGGNYPDGPLVREIFAVRDDGAKEVQLTDDPTLATYYLGRALVWGIDDTEVTWSAKRWGDDPVMPEEFGIYSAAISFDANGDVIGLSEEPTLIWDTGYHYEAWADDYIPNVKRFDWSPDGSKIAFIQGSLRTINPDGTDEQVIVAPITKGKDKGGHVRNKDIDWSPDSSHLVYTWIASGRGHNNPARYDVYRVEANGDYPTSMTDDIEGSPASHAWR
ncbi:MAG: hypothetical protein KAW84_04260 [Thermoplasmata archaeon]|nr:hypothetical protein [Thermoplasmata archaeon]